MKPQDYDHDDDQTEPAPESEQIRAEIEQTRESMDQTLYEIGEKMKPRHMFDKVLGFLHLKKSNGHAPRENGHHEAETDNPSPNHLAGRAAQAVTGVVRDHPIPMLLISAGVAWAIYESRARSAESAPRRKSTPSQKGGSSTAWEEYQNENLADEPTEFFETSHAGAPRECEGEDTPSATEKIKDKVSAAGHQLQDKARQVRQRASESARAIGQKAVQVKDKIGRQAQRTYASGKEKFVETSQAHPLCVGLGFLAIGTLVGLALPPSRQEDQWVGQVADQVKDRAKSKGEDLMERGKHVALAAADAAKRSAAEEGLTPETLKAKAKQIASEAGRAAEESAGQQGWSAPRQTNPAQLT
jgi:hypothetical protein